MIVYESGVLGIQILSRFHGSALLRATIPAIVSTAIFLGLEYMDGFYEFGKMFDHPYALGVFMAAFTFLLTFKASFSYNRYWEACTAVHQMHSKWLDVGMELASFHLQSSYYQSVRPPTFGAHPDITSVRRDRDRLNEMNASDLSTHLDSVTELSFFEKLMKRRKKKKRAEANHRSINATSGTGSVSVSAERNISHLKSVSVLDGGMKYKEPSLFLQEATHLISLLSAVAFSTLRNDNENADSPLIQYQPGSPWPPVDPDDLKHSKGNIRPEYFEPSRFVTVLYYWLGLARTEKSRALYNAARPFRVIGGVSDAEIQLLQRARGPLAKVALCTMWLQEFISREYMAGSTGAVAPPIISRLFQYTSDGMVGYNQARKVAYVPFPFPHNQVTTFFILVVIIYLPFLFLSYVPDVPLGASMNFFSVLIFCSLHEVARELENPFQNAPNDLPLNNFQAKFNEALLTMYSGFHPDSWWEVEGKVKTQDGVKEEVDNEIS